MRSTHQGLAGPRFIRLIKTIYLTLAVCLFGLVGCATTPTYDDTGFEPLFDGKSLRGWELLNPKGGGYGVTNLVENGVTNAVIYCAQGGGGNLLSEKAYADFVLRFDFKLTAGANNGLAIRAPLKGGSLAYEGMELQILDNYGAEKKYNKKLRPNQFHGALYNIQGPSVLDAQRPVGEWNTQEVIAQGRRIIVKVNGRTILNADLNEVTDAKTLIKHPGILRPSGHIGFLGHNDEIFIKNIRIKELTTAQLGNRPPAGFEALFNGRNLAGWQGLLASPNDNPYKRATLAPEVRAEAQAKANEEAVAHWKVEDGQLVFDGQGRSLSTAREDYANYELHVDWKIAPKGDSGLYLRGTPQVQIWDPREEENPKGKFGSGGLYNNQAGVSDPLVKADYVTGSWNHFRILMIESRVHVFLNNQIVVKNTPLENYWDRKKPVLAEGPIELQAHSHPVWFKNIYIREIK